MNKLFKSFICFGAMALLLITPKAFAGEKANVVVTDSPGKEIVMKTITVTSGSSTATPSGLGTVTGSVFTANSDDIGSATTFKVLNSGGNVTVYAYNPVTGATATTNHTGTAFIWGTP